MSRASFSNKVIQSLIAGTEWTRDIPLGAQSRVLRGITPAHESDHGRGAPFFDIWRRASLRSAMETGSHDEMVSFKVGKGKYLPAAPPLTIGNDRHVQAVLEAAQNGTRMPVVVLHLKGDTWFYASFDLAKMVSRFGLERAAQGRGKGRGQGKPVVWGDKIQRTRVKNKAGNVKTYEYAYRYLAVNIKAAGIQWHEIGSTLDGWDFSDCI